MKEIYEAYDKLQEILTLKKGTNHGLPAFRKMCQTGQCPLSDYNQGFIGVKGYVSSFHQKEGEYVVRLWFGTIDDGDYGGWSKPMSLEKATTLLWRIADEVFVDMLILPNTEDMNLKLRPYGLYVDFE